MSPRTGPLRFGTRPVGLHWWRRPRRTGLRCSTSTEPGCAASSFCWDRLPCSGRRRLVHRQAIVYIGLAHLTAAALDLTWWAGATAHTDIRLAWVGLAAAVLALVLGIAAVALRRTRLSAFYTEPCLETAFLLTVIAFIVALDARYLGREAFRLGVATLATNAAVSVLLLATWRRAELAYAGVFHVVVATYLVLFSTGHNDPAMAYILGLVAVVEALLLWVGSLLCAPVSHPVVKGCAGPLSHWAVFMTGLAVLLCAGSPVTMAFVSLSCLIAVKALPRSEWLYGSIVALCVACYWKWLESWSGAPLVGLVLAVAFGFWLLAVLVDLGKPALCKMLRLSQLPYEYPFFHAAMAAAAIAIALRLSLSTNGSVAWTGYAWFPLGLSILCVLMVPRLPNAGLHPRCACFSDLVYRRCRCPFARFGVLDRSGRGGSGPRLSRGRASAASDRAGDLRLGRRSRRGVFSRCRPLGMGALRHDRLPGHRD